MAVAALVATAAVVLLVWNRVRLESRLGDSDLSGAIAAQPAQVAQDAVGYVASTDDIETVLLLTADGLDPVGPALVSVRILALDRTQGAARLVSVPIEAKADAESSATLAQVYGEQGYAACVTSLASASGVSFDHVVVATEDVIEQAASLAGTDASSLVREASGLLSKIRTDLDAAGLLSLAEGLSSAGAGVESSEAILVPEAVTDEAGNPVETGAQVIEKTQLAVALGLLVPAA